MSFFRLQSLMARPLPRLAIAGAVLIYATSGSHAAPPASPKLPVECGFIGNSYPGAQHWIPQDIEALAVLPDGTIFSNVGWDEAGGNVTEFKDGKVIATAKHTHGWGANGGHAVTASDKYVYFSMVMGNEGGRLQDPETWPPAGTTWFGIMRRLRSDLGQGAPFAGGKGGKGDTVKGSFLPINALPGKSPDGQIAGLAVDARHLYVSNPVTQEIVLLDPETMARQVAWPVEKPGPIALSPKGELYVLQRTSPERIVRLGVDGKPVGPAIVLAPAAEKKRSTAFCVSPKGELCVTDTGAAQDIMVYDSTSGATTRRVGVSGGIYAPPIPGKVGPLRFNELSAIGYDGAGNLVVAHHASTGGGSTLLESYTPELKLAWRLMGLTFVDMAETDPKDATQVYTKDKHFVYHPGQLAEYVGYTVNPYAYPDDPRLHLWSGAAWVRRIQGRRFLFVHDMNASWLQVYRFADDNAESAIPSGFIAQRHVTVKGGENWPPHQPAKGEWIWRDANGNGAMDEGEYATRQGEDCPAAQGWWVTDTGDLWLATETQGIRQFPCLGLDAKGNPQWDYAHMKVFPKPDELDAVKRLRYDVVSDTMILGGVKGAEKNQHWKPMGPVLCCYDHWSKPEERKLRWSAVEPYVAGSKGHESCEPMGFDWAGDYLFVPYTGASKHDGIKTGHVEVFRAKDGSSVGSFEPGDDIGEVGLQDLRECLTARKLADGSYLVLMEDDAKSKVLAYHWQGEKATSGPGSQTK